MLTRAQIQNAPEEKQDDESAKPGEGARPEYVPEKFWSEESGVNVEAMAKSYAEAEKLIGRKEEEMRAKLQEEMKTARPETAQSYELNVPEIEAPEGVELKVANEDPMIQKMKVWAYESNLTQDQFDSALKLYMESMVDGIPDPKQEMQALGENAEGRLQALAGVAKKALNEQEIDEFLSMTTRAKSVEIMEKLLAAVAPSGPRDFEASAPTTQSLMAELNELMATDAYWRRDKATIDRVVAIQERLAKAAPRARAG